MKISGNTSGFMHLLATHPPIEGVWRRWNVSN